jgi:hypothetical protein
MQFARTAAKSSKPKMDSGNIAESATNSATSATGSASNEASSSQLPTPPSHVLDPSLFAASFAKKRVPISAPPTAKTTSLKLQSTKPTKKRFGIAKGYDGQPMKRLKDGRTVVRVLQKDTMDVASVEGRERIEETLQAPSALDPTEVLPNAKIRGFRKQKLGLRDEGKQVKTTATAKRISRSEEDPLGLEDPAFMKGGELEGVGLAPKRQFKGKPRPSTQLRGRRTKCESTVLGIYVIAHLYSSSSHTINDQARSSTTIRSLIVILSIYCLFFSAHTGC